MTSCSPSAFALVRTLSVPGPSSRLAQPRFLCAAAPPSPSKPPPPSSGPSPSAPQPKQPAGADLARQDIAAAKRLFERRDRRREFASYDPVAISDYYRARPVLAARRAAEVVLPLAAWFARTRVSRALGGGEDSKRRNAVALRNVICAAGATVLKLGQAASARPDVVGGAYREELLKLVDDVPGFDGEVAEGVVVRELGLEEEGLSSVFERFERVPVAAASLGQVHRARLNSGEEVAIKVLRPEVRVQAGLDLYLLRAVAGVAKKRFGLRSDLVGIVDEFGSRLWEELDYLSEARNTERFKELYVGKVPGVYAPKVYREHTTGMVLVTEWVDGDKPAWEPVEDAERLIAVGVRCSLTQILQDGFVHGDPHSGNILRRGGASGDLCYLDFGMCVTVERATRVDLIRSITNLVNRNYDELAKDFARLGFLPEGTDTAPLVPKLQKAFADARDGDSNQLAELSFGKLADNLADLAYTSPIRIPVSFTILIRSLTILEGLALATRKDFKIIDAAYPFVVERLLEDDSPELQKCLEDVLLDSETKRLRWNRLSSILEAEGKDPAGSFPFASKPNLPHVGSSSLTGDTADRITNYILSPRGKFLRDALTRELTEMLDSSQLQIARRLSRATGGLIPEPKDKPDKAQLERAAALVKSGPQLFKSVQQVQRKRRGRGGGNRIGSEVGRATWTAIGEVTDRNTRRIIQMLGAAALDALLGPRSIDGKSDV